MTISEKLIDSLDELIKNGIIDANYKFGQANTQAASDSRHDAITIYFNAPPTDDALRYLSALASRYYRGDTLLGKKISKGFYMSEVGSVTEAHIQNLLLQLEPIDSKLKKGVQNYVTGTGGRIAMSEAQYYALQESLSTFGVDITYSSEDGFRIGNIH